METRDLESKFGQLQKVYGASMTQVVKNAIFASIAFVPLALAVTACLWGYAPGLAIIWGLIVLAPGVAFIVIPYRQRIGSEVRLYADGVWVNNHGKMQEWHFDEIIGVNVLYGERKVAGGIVEGIFSVIPATSFIERFVTGAAEEGSDLLLDAAMPADELVGIGIDRYQFYVSGTPIPAFEIGLRCKEWKELGSVLFARVMGRLVPRIINRLSQGEQITVEAISNQWGSKTYLTLTQKGIQEKDKPFVLWEDITEVAAEKGFVVLKAAGLKKDIIFKISSQSTLLTSQVVRTMVKEARTIQR